MPRGVCCRSELRRSNDAWLQGMDMEELRSTDRKRSLVTISNFATTPSTQFWENFRRTLIQVGRSVAAGHSLATVTSSRGETFVLCLQLHRIVTDDDGWLCVCASCWSQYKREPVLTRARLVNSMLMGLLLGAVYFQQPNTYHAVQNKLGVLFIITINQTISSLFGVVQVSTTSSPTTTSPVRRTLTRLLPPWCWV